MTHYTDSRDDTNKGKHSMFAGLLKNPREGVVAPEGSDNWACLQLPAQREYIDINEIRGHTFYFPRTDIIGVPYLTQGSGHWSVVILDGGKQVLKENGDQMYPAGGYDISVSDLEMTTAIELGVEKPGHAVSTRMVHLISEQYQELYHVTVVAESEAHWYSRGGVMFPKSDYQVAVE